MSHSINFLKDDEIHYLSAAASNPIYKWAAIGVVTIAISSVGIYYYTLQRTIAEGRNLRRRWNNMEKMVGEAEVRNRKRDRLEIGTQTIQGWTQSRIDWVGVMGFIVDQVPGTIDDMQFSRLEIDEIVEGLRTNKPGMGTTAGGFAPLVRQVEMKLRGEIRSTRPERQLTQFQRNLLNGPSPYAIDEVRLDRYTTQRDGGEVTDRTTFAFTIKISPIEMVAVEEEETEEEETEDGEATP